LLVRQRPVGMRQQGRAADAQRMRQQYLGVEPRRVATPGPQPLSGCG